MATQPAPKKRKATKPTKIQQENDQKTTTSKSLVGAVDSIGRSASELRVGFAYKLPNGNMTAFDSPWPAWAYDIAEKAFFAKKRLFIQFTSEPKGDDLILVTCSYKETDLLP